MRKIERNFNNNNQNENDSLIENIVRDEFKKFKLDFYKTYLEIEQENRSFCIQFFMSFIPLNQLISNQLYEEISEFVEAIQKSHIFDIETFHLFPIEAGLYVYTEEHTFLERIKNSLYHPNSSIREAAFNSLVLINHKIDYSKSNYDNFFGELRNFGLIQAFEINLKNNQFFSEWGAILLLTSLDDDENSEFKKNLLKNWIHEFSLNLCDKKILAKLYNNMAVENPFSVLFCRILVYVLQKIILYIFYSYEIDNLDKEYIKKIIIEWFENCNYEKIKNKIDKNNFDLIKKLITNNEYPENNFIGEINYLLIDIIGDLIFDKNINNKFYDNENFEQKTNANEYFKEYLNGVTDNTSSFFYIIEFLFNNKLWKSKINSEEK